MLRRAVWNAFAARHINRLTRSLRQLQHSQQPKAMCIAIFILSMLPDPMHTPPYRRFLLSDQFVGIPNIVAEAISLGVEWMVPSGPGKISTLILNCLTWGMSSDGDDGRAPIDVVFRDALVNIAETALAASSLSLPPTGCPTTHQDQQAVRSLLFALYGIDAWTGAQAFLDFRRKHLEEQSGHHACWSPPCSAEVEDRCSRCQMALYCGVNCQSERKY